MDDRFPVGTWALHPHPNLDFQLNRLVTLGGGRLEDVQPVAPRIRSLRDWKRELLGLAERALVEERVLNAAAYLRAAEFFMPASDPGKAAAYDQQAEMSRAWRADDLRRGLAVESSVPFAGGTLPLWRFPAQAARAKSAVVVHGGYDSYAEELYPLLRHVAALGYDVVFFEGPGQGAVARRQGVPFTADWHRPVAAVLDACGLEEVTLVGISLGGCLALRAAAREPRIARVVAFDVMWDLFEVALASRPAPVRAALRALLAAGARETVDRLARREMTRDLLAEWGIEHGRLVLGAATPARYFERLRAFTTRDVSPRVRQDVLLLAGSEDHFVPLAHYHRQAAALTGVRSLAGRIFTRAECAQAHCQVGNLPLTLRVISDWIDERCSARPHASRSRLAAA
jgi:pimeloyl-ACP methyl ester carboxylesterase